MAQVNIGFTQYNDDDLYHTAKAIVLKVGALPVFAPLASKLPPLDAAADDLNTATNLPSGPTRDASILAARAGLINLLQLLAGALMDTAGVTDPDLAATGYDLRTGATHSSLPPDAPQNVRLKTMGITRELQVLLGKVLRAIFYEVEYALDPVSGPWTGVPSFTSTRGMVLSGLTRGKDYYVRVRAVAAGQNRGPWSDVATAMAL